MDTSLRDKQNLKFREKIQWYLDGVSAHGERAQGADSESDDDDEDEDDYDDCDDEKIDGNDNGDDDYGYSW